MKVKKISFVMNTSFIPQLIGWEILSTEMKTFHAHFHLAVIYSVVFYTSKIIAMMYFIF